METIYTGVLTPAALADPNNTHAILIRLVGEDREVLEIGPATGYMTRILVNEKNCRVTGFELNAQAAAEAAPLLKHLIVGNLENPDDLARLDGRFDVILLADVVEHLAEPSAPLRTLRAHLRPEGRLIVSMPNVAHWSIRRALLTGRWDLTDRGLMDRTHLRWYTLRTAIALLESTGYRILLRRSSYAFPGHWRLGIGPRLAVWAQARRMPTGWDELFAIQHILVAVPA
ncbi:MAG: class I SAM-dependent methyltransferase [Anaerolineae bacterium]